MNTYADRVREYREFINRDLKNLIYSALTRVIRSTLKKNDPEYMASILKFSRVTITLNVHHYNGSIYCDTFSEKINNVDVNLTGFVIDILFSTETREYVKRIVKEHFSGCIVESRIDANSYKFIVSA